MMHPVDFSRMEQEQSTPRGDTPVWWTFVALVIVTALLVIAVIVLTGDETGEPPAPQPTEAPSEPGA